MSRYVSILVLSSLFSAPVMGDGRGAIRDEKTRCIQYGQTVTVSGVVHSIRTDEERHRWWGNTSFTTIRLDNPICTWGAASEPREYTLQVIACDRIWPSTLRTPHAKITGVLVHNDTIYHTRVLIRAEQIVWTIGGRIPACMSVETGFGPSPGRVGFPPV